MHMNEYEIYSFTRNIDDFSKVYDVLKVSVDFDAC